MKKHQQFSKDLDISLCDIRGLTSEGFKKSRGKKFPSHEIALQFDLQFLCECVPAKIEYLKKAFPEVKFIFSDMQDLPREKAHNVLTNKIQDVPEAARLSMSV